MWWHVLVAHGLALAAIIGFTELELWYNAYAIQKDGSKDSLRQAFHNRRALIRVVFDVLVVVGGTYPTWGHWAATACSAGAITCALIGYFPYRFNTGLNQRRGLDKYYISFTDWASKWDRWFAGQAKKIKLKGLPDDRKMIVWYELAKCSHRWVLWGLLLFGGYQFINLTWFTIIKL